MMPPYTVPTNPVNSKHILKENNGNNSIEDTKQRQVHETSSKHVEVVKPMCPTPVLLSGNNGKHFSTQMVCQCW
jgi:hypothetical protein